MLKHLTLILIAIEFFAHASGQSVQYSKKIRLENTETPFIAGLYNDRYHLIKQDGWGKITLVIYNYDLSIDTQIILPSEKKGYAEIQIIPYTGFYYAYINFRQVKKYMILKIDAQGIVENITEILQKKFPISLLHNTDMWNLRKVNNRIFITTYVYDKAGEKLFFNIINTDSSFTKMDERTLILNYKFEREQINSIFFTDTATAYVTRCGRNATSNFGQVDISVHDLITGTSRNINLSSPKDFFLSPELTYNEKDSSFYFLANLRDKASANKMARYYFVSMNKALEERSPSVQVQFKDLFNQNVVMLIVNSFSFLLPVNNFLLNNPDRKWDYVNSVISYNNGWGKYESWVYSEDRNRNLNDMSLPGYNSNPNQSTASNISPFDLRVVYMDPRYPGKKICY